jgi:hypothetical protein
VEAVQDPSAQISMDDFIALCKQLGHIHGALTRATGVTFEADDVSASSEDPPTMITTKEFLTLLRGLQDQCIVSNAFHRNLLQTMLAQAEGLMERGVEQCNMSSIHEFLERSAEEEQCFLDVVRQELPRLMAIIQTLKTSGNAASAPSSDLENIVERVAQLWSAAQQVNASHAMLFFMGLHSFLTIVTQHHVVVGATRYDAIQSRLDQSLKGIEEWAANGRMERVAIQRVLPCAS